MKTELTPASVTLTEPFHLFIQFGNGNEQRTHLGGFNTIQEALKEQEKLQPKAKEIMKNDSYRFKVLNGPVTLEQHEQQYGGPWDKE